MKTKWFIILVVLLLILGSSSCLAKTVLETKGNNIMKIALCHLEVSCGPQEKNLEKIERAVKIAGEHGARLVATPETAVQGYYFHRIDETRQLEVQPADYLDSLRNTVKEEQVYLLLGCGEYVPETGLHHNSCLVFAPDGNLQSRHRKIYGEKLGSEKWASPGEKVSTTIRDAVKVGVLVCADSWFDERPLALKEQGAVIDSIGLGDNIVLPDKARVGVVYKNVAVEKNGEFVSRIKVSNDAAKAITPGYKKVYRFYDKDTGYALGDVIALHEEHIPTDEFTLIDPLNEHNTLTIKNYRVRELQVPIFVDGVLVYEEPTIQEKQGYHLNEMKTLYPEVKRTENPHGYYIDLTRKKLNILNNIKRKY